MLLGNQCETLSIGTNLYFCELDPTMRPGHQRMSPLSARLLPAATNIGKFLMFHCAIGQNETREPR